MMRAVAGAAVAAVGDDVGVANGDGAAGIGGNGEGGHLEEEACGEKNQSNPNLLELDDV
jgi:hypothetical protein